MLFIRMSTIRETISSISETVMQRERGVQKGEPTVQLAVVGDLSHIPNFLLLLHSVFAYADRTYVWQMIETEYPGSLR